MPLNTLGVYGRITLLAEAWKREVRLTRNPRWVRKGRLERV